MAPKQSLLFAALVVLVILVVYVLSGVAAKSETILDGFWAGEPAFMKDSNLASLFLYVEPADSDGRRSGYVVATDRGGQEVTNQKLELNLAGGPGRLWRAGNLASGGPYCTRGSFEFENASCPSLPTDAKFELDPSDGSLAVYDDAGELRARLLRDNEVSRSLSMN